MKHRVVGRKLGRSSSHRLALLRNMSTALFDKERIKTTLDKAKELRPFAERLVTLCKAETLQARRRVARHVHDGRVVAKMFDTLSARFAMRPGGYTRIIRLGPRRGDSAEMVFIELVGATTTTEAAEPADAGTEATKGDKAPRAKKKAAKTSAAGAGTGATETKKKKAGRRASATASKSKAAPSAGKAKSGTEARSKGSRKTAPRAGRQGKSSGKGD